MDNFREEIIVRKTGKTLYAVGYVVAFITMLLSGVMTFITLMEMFVFYHIDVSVIVMLVISGGLTILLWLKKDTLRLDYEYTLTNGEMDFAKVLGNKRRKHLLTMHLKTAEQGGPVESDAYARLSKTPNVKTLDLTINTNTQRYFIYFVQNGIRTMLVLEPSRTMIGMMRSYNRNFAEMSEAVS